jgi:hypothetical protein
MHTTASVLTAGLPFTDLRCLVLLGASCERKRTCCPNSGEGRDGRVTRDEDATAEAMDEGPAARKLESAPRIDESMVCRECKVS